MLSTIKKFGFFVLSEISKESRLIVIYVKYFISYIKSYGFIYLGVCIVVLSIFSVYPLFKDVIVDVYTNGFDDSEPADSSSPGNILAVKESPSNPTVGIISNSKGKPGYLYVPGKKSYEVTYEEDGILKTKTMSSDPTK